MTENTEEKSMDSEQVTSAPEERQSLKNLMATGEGLKGFAWPENCGDFEMKIARDGTWFYRGSPIGRKKLCQLFATVLQRDEDGKYWLVTPVERGEIEVEDAPFVALEMRKIGEGKSQELSFRTNLDHWVVAGKENPIRVHIDLETQEPSPYVMVRDNMEALINRPVFYDLVELAEEQDVDGHMKFGLWSSGQFFELGSLE